MTRIMSTRAGRIEKQVSLPWSKAVEISAKSIRIRFWRSMITMSGVVLAIAFLMTIWTQNAAVKSLAMAEDPTIDLLLQRARIDPGEIREVGGAFSARDWWLIVLALVVCFVGIVNAMLMSVAERFREIGTMKCLGALDSFVVRIFFLESSFTGAVGTVIGIFVGLVLSLVRASIMYKVHLWQHFPAVAILQGIGASLIVGVILSIGAAIWPARSAARMQPVEAMQARE